MAPDRPVFRYHDDVLAALWTYGVRPTEHTPPELVRGFINDLYRHELRLTAGEVVTLLEGHDEVAPRSAAEQRVPETRVPRTCGRDPTAVPRPGLAPARVGEGLARERATIPSDGG